MDRVACCWNYLLQVARHCKDAARPDRDCYKEPLEQVGQAGRGGYRANAPVHSSLTGQSIAPRFVCDQALYVVISVHSTLRQKASSDPSKVSYLKQYIINCGPALLMSPESNGSPDYGYPLGGAYSGLLLGSGSSGAGDHPVPMV